MSSSVIPATTPVSWTKVPDGTAATPSFAFQNSSSTGIYRVAADSLGISTAGVQRVVVDASGNVGVGTASPAQKLHIASGGVIRLNRADNNAIAYGEFNYGGSGVGFQWNDTNSDGYTFKHGGTTVMRIDASGNLLVGTTDASPTSGVGMKLLYGSANMVSVVANYNANIAHFYLYNLSATNNGARFSVNTNGGISNYSANNTNLSDERVKTDISLASSYLEKICSIPVKTFRYKDQGDDMDLTLGVIAQDVERVAPELVNITDGFGDIPEDGVPLKTVYQTDLQYALMKCIQELKEKNDALEARLAALEAK